VLDRAATTGVVTRLFSNERLTETDDGSLDMTCPDDQTIIAGCFPGLTILAASELGLDYPSQLDKRLVDAVPGTNTYLHCMHSVVDWFAYAIWEHGTLVRSLSLSPDHGIIEDLGPRQAFETSFWNGEHPALDPEEDPSDYPFVFHPLELGEAALGALFGFHLEGVIGPDDLEPSDIALMSFKRGKKAWWRW